MDRQNLLEELKHKDVLEQYRVILEQEGYIVDMKNKKISRPYVGLEWDSPWIHIVQDPKMLCHVYRHIVLQVRFIPKRCLTCWKVVVRLNTVQQLFALYDVMKVLNAHSKLGIEEREWVGGNYGAYFYTTSISQGRRRWGQVMRAMAQEPLLRPLVAATMEEDGKDYVTLKRYCTEYELLLGPSDKYEVPEMAEVWEKAAFAHFDLTKWYGQPQYVKDHVMFRWLKFAYERGDETALLFNDGKPFVTPPVTYHVKEDYYGEESGKKVAVSG